MLSKPRFPTTRRCRRQTKHRAAGVGLGSQVMVTHPRRGLMAKLEAACLDGADSFRMPCFDHKCRILYEYRSTEYSQEVPGALHLPRGSGTRACSGPCDGDATIERVSGVYVCGSIHVTSELEIHSSTRRTLTGKHGCCGNFDAAQAAKIISEWQGLVRVLRR